MTHFDAIEELEVPVCIVLEPGLDSPFHSVQALAQTVHPTLAAPVLEISQNDELYNSIVDGYSNDTWCQKALNTTMDNLQQRGKLLYYKGRLVVPRCNNLPTTLASLAHNALGHFGFDKTYAAMRDTFYWPGMQTFLEHSFIPSCDSCQRAKAPTVKPAGPLHPLPISDHRFQSVAIDFVGPFPEEEGCDHILTMTDQLGADVRLIPCRASLTARELATIFFNHWFCENGLPNEIVSDRGSLFLSQFWRHLHELTGISLKMSTSFHLQTDGLSERTNKTLNQALRIAVDRHHTGWSKALPRIRFNIMNTKNASTGFSSFQLRLGFSPRLIPPLIKQPIEDSVETPGQFLERMARDVGTACDNLLEAKILQAEQSNKHRTPDLTYAVGDKLLLSTKNLSSDASGVPFPTTKKLRPKYIGPFTVTNVDLAHSTVTLDLPAARNKCQVFHTSLVKPYHAFIDDPMPEHFSMDKTNPVIGPEQAPPKDPPSKMTNGRVEHFIHEIVDHKKSGRGFRFLVRWQGFPDSHNEWKTFSELNHTKALDDYLRKHTPLL
jgi:hypothetical protein